MTDPEPGSRIHEIAIDRASIENVKHTHMLKLRTIPLSTNYYSHFTATGREI